MARNGSGTFTKVNTFVAGQSVTAAGHNQNWDDLATEMTNSVAADGQTTLTGPLKLSNGTVSAPALTFGSDTNHGLYRIGADNLGVSLAGSKVGDWSTTGLAITGTLSASGLLTASAGLAVTTAGIAFPATQSASADANTLDDYEEGTFTPALKFGGNAVGLTYTAQLGSYVKVGKLVFVEINITVNSNGSSTGSATITGLPFTSNATTQGILNLVQQDVMDENGVQMWGEIDAGGTSIALIIVDVNGGAVAFDEESFPDGAKFSLSGHYIAAA